MCPDDPAWGLAHDMAHGPAHDPAHDPVHGSNAAIMIWSRITTEPLEPLALLARVEAASCGAALLFVGMVRDHADGRAVSGMRYEAYRDMAETVLAEIAREAEASLGGGHVAVEHRIGSLELGEASVLIAVSSPHRAEAYAASRHVIEQIKVRLPVWKHEHYVDGASQWVEGTQPAAPSADPREGA